MRKQDDVYTIGKVVKMLQEEFGDDVSVSKVRFLEQQGIVRPQRTKSRYRTYTDADVERLRHGLAMKQTLFYPWSKICEVLDAAEKGAPLPTAESDARPASPVLPSALTLEELSERTGVPASFVRTLEEAGLLSLEHDEKGRAVVRGEDAGLARDAFELKRFGIDPRFLRPYLQQANRELPLFKQVLTPVAGRSMTLEDERTRAEFDSTLARLLALTNSVRDSLVTRELRREFKCPRPEQGR